MAENLAEIDPPAADGVVVHPLDAPIHAEPVASTSSPASLAPKGAVVKVAGLSDDADAVRGSGARVRRRVVRDGGDPRRVDPARHGDRDPLRGPEGRPGHARDARDHRRAQGCRPRVRLCADHRRSLLRRHLGILHRPRRARSRRRRPDRVRPRRRHDPHRRADQVARPARRRRRTRRTARTAGSRTRPATPPACSASTPSSSRAPRPARSPTRSESTITPGSDPRSDHRFSRRGLVGPTG